MHLITYCLHKLWKTLEKEFVWTDRKGPASECPTCLHNIKPGCCYNAERTIGPEIKSTSFSSNFTSPFQPRNPTEAISYTPELCLNSPNPSRSSSVWGLLAHSAGSRAPQDWLHVLCHLTPKWKFASGQIFSRLWGCWKVGHKTAMWFQNLQAIATTSSCQKPALPARASVPPSATHLHILHSPSHGNATFFFMLQHCKLPPW